MNGQTAKTKKIFDGRYEILSIVGRGARSVVYHARHVSSPTTEVALKVLIDQKGKNPSAERLRREALAMVSCRHRYIARLDDFHSVGSICYLSMEYAPQSDLRNFVKKNGGKLSLEQAERFLKQSAEGISFVHRAGIIHRDIKPENILVMSDKEVRITDFGVALLPGEECSIADLQSGVGTMNYMAPEILEGKPADQRSDLYALGVVFYELLGGQNPFAGAPLAKQIDVRKNEKFPSLAEIDPSIPKYLSDLIFQCMRYDPDNRFSSGDDLLASLINKKSENFAREQKTQSAKPSRPRTNNIHKRRRKVQARKDIQAENDLFDEFDRLIAQDNPIGIQHPESTIVNYDSPSVSEHDQPEAEVLNAKTEGSAPQPEDAQDSLENSDDFFGIASEKSEEDVFEEPDNHQTSEEADHSDINSLAEQISVPDSDDHDFDDDFQEDLPRSRPSRPGHETSLNKRASRWIIFAVSAAIILGVILPGIRSLISGNTGSGLGALAFWTKSEIELPIFEAETLTFPLLPKGVFSGSLEGIIPGRQTPLTIISFGENGKIAVLLGIEGWTPVVLDQQEISSRSGNGKAKSLRAASNGIILELNGEVSDGRITGYFSNLITGVRGEWMVEPAI